MFRKNNIPPFFEKEEYFTKSLASNNHFQYESSTYADYIQWTRKQIETGRVQLPTDSPKYIQKCIEANVATEFRPIPPSRHGILLIHGLMSSPMGMSSLYDYFSKKNYLVRSLLLPGHGTRPGDLLDVTYQDWLESCRFAIRTLREEVEHVTVVAFSAGSSLALYLSLTEQSIDSLVLLAPAISLKHPLSPYYAKTLYSLRKLSSRMNWPVLKKEDDYAKYQSIPINAIYQITRLMKKIARINASLEIPLYLVSTPEDETISHQKALNFFLKQKNPLNRGIIYTKNLKLEVPSSLKCRMSTYYNEKILDFSHIALAVSSEHPHYGKKGDFTEFSHYQNKDQELKSKSIYYGAVSKGNLKNYYVQRLSYNPDFDYLASDIEKFLKECFPSRKTFF